MTAFQRTIIGLIVIIGIMWLFTKHTSDIQIVYPDNCVYVVDHVFSAETASQIKAFIDRAYKKSKNPSGLLPAIEGHFGCVRSIIIDMHNPEALHFTIQAYHPMFMINDEHVVCHEGKMFSMSVFAQDQLAKLENIHFDQVVTPKHVQRLTDFFVSLPSLFFQDFSVRWVDKHAIWLDQKKDKGFSCDLSLLVGFDVVPTEQDIMDCRKLRGQIVDKPCKDKKGKPCKDNITWVCDLRFNEQIVVFSTNKGV
jgi:hypothetical protein